MTRRLVFCSLVLYLLVVATPLCAQTTATATTTTTVVETRLVPDLIWPTALYIGAAGADWAVSAVCFRHRCDAQGHPMLYRVDDPKVNVPFGLAIDAGIVAFSNLYLGRKSPMWAAVVLYGLTAFRVVYLSHKVGDLRRNTRRIR